MLLIPISVLVYACDEVLNKPVLSEAEITGFAIKIIEKLVEVKNIHLVKEIRFVGKEKKHRNRDQEYWYVEFICAETATNYQKMNLCPYSLELSNENPPKLLVSYQNIF